MNGKWIPFFLILVTGGLGAAELKDFPATPRDLVLTARERARNGVRQQALLAEYARNIRKDLRMKPISIVWDKTVTAASGDAHDYISFGRYWWPDPARPDGLPYIRRDGVTNPAYRRCDAPKVFRIASVVPRLAARWYFCGDRAAAAKAAELLRVFFLDPETRMNPNLNHGQAIPGRVPGRTEGIIDTFSLIRVADAVVMLRDFDGFPPEQQRGMIRWFADYAKWLTASPMARRDYGSEQNHGISYHTQVLVYSKLAGDRRTALEHGKKLETLAVKMVAADGSLPKETVRTRSWHYSNMALKYMFCGMAAAKDLGIDFFSPGNPAGPAVARAAAYLASFEERPEKWPYRQQEKITFEYQPLFAVYLHYFTGDSKYLAAARKHEEYTGDGADFALFFAPVQQDPAQNSR